MILLRSGTGLSQYGFADAIGYSRGYLAAVEQGRKLPSRRMVTRLMEVFRVDPNWLLAGDPGDPDAKAALGALPMMMARVSRDGRLIGLIQSLESN
ncbi:MAG: helix-turn-helix transcriptional regulator [Rhodospirillales bacterium]|nr:helix-turn-helix transcriptional regulator [Rhodospirillales bacterium]